MIKNNPPLNRAVDPAKWAFDIGCALLTLYGESGRPARAIVARWLKRAGSAPKLIDILVRAGAAERGDLRAFVEAALKPEAAPAAPPQRIDPDDVLRLRCERLGRLGLLDMISPTDQARARAKGWLPSEKPAPETGGHLPSPPRGW